MDRADDLQVTARAYRATIPAHGCGHQSEETPLHPFPGAHADLARGHRAHRRLRPSGGDWRQRPAMAVHRLRRPGDPGPAESAEPAGGQTRPATESAAMTRRVWQRGVCYLDSPRKAFRNRPFSDLPSPGAADGPIARPSWQTRNLTIWSEPCFSHSSSRVDPQVLRLRRWRSGRRPWPRSCVPRHCSGRARGREARRRPAPAASRACWQGARRQSGRRSRRREPRVIVSLVARPRWWRCRSSSLASSPRRHAVPRRHQPQAPR